MYLYLSLIYNTSLPNTLYLVNCTTVLDNYEFYSYVKNTLCEQ